MNVTLTELFATIGRYLLTIEATDILDIAIMAFALYKVLTLVQTTKAASLLKGLFVFLAALLLSYLFGLNGIYYLLSRMVEVGVLALIILFQPELRRFLEQVGSGKIKELFGRTADKRLVNVGIGAAATALIQSSGVTTVLIVGFVNVGAMDLYQAAAMIMGPTSAPLSPLSSLASATSLQTTPS